MRNGGVYSRPRIEDCLPQRFCLDVRNNLGHGEVLALVENMQLWICVAVHDVNKYAFVEATILSTKADTEVEWRCLDALEGTKAFSDVLQNFSSIQCCAL